MKKIMNKVINVVLMGVVSCLGSLFIVSIWIIGFIFLIFNEIPGAKRFRTRLHKLNGIIKEEFIEVFNVFHKLGRAK